MPYYCSIERSKQITGADLRAYMDTHFTADRMVIAGVDVDHDELVKESETYFAGIKAHAIGGKVLPQPAKYLGGEMRMHVPDEHRSKMEIMVNPRLMTHVGLMFPVGGIQHPDYVAQCVLHVLLGGGSSFSSGGPGKGMYSKLYKEVLNRYHW